MFFCRSNSDKQQQQNNKNQKRIGKQQQPTKTSLLSQQKASTNSLNNYSNSTPQRYSLVGPLVSLRHQTNFVRSPFVPLPFEHSVSRKNLSLRDDDLLPSCWFLSDSEINDLTQRAHYKLQRRISRRRSLTRANFPFGETNPRRAKVIEKYDRLRIGIRRALSDHQILFMDLKDVECDVKPILTRRNSCRSNRNNNASTSFRNRVGTSLSVGGCHDDENDYYSFRAWRRGSRLSVDVLNRAAICSANFDGVMGRNSQTEQRLPLTGWALVLKRVLADWIKRRKRTNNESVVIAVEEEVEKEINEEENNSSTKMN
uniref:Uncharacterized protein n=1 Tax=Meloidogyne floridensis TaxID=298350 RepID=A0A915P961_9BILA